MSTIAKKYKTSSRYPSPLEYLMMKVTTVTLVKKNKSSPKISSGSKRKKVGHTLHDEAKLMQDGGEYY